jgi:hypothetical protein
MNGHFSNSRSFSNTKVVIKRKKVKGSKSHIDVSQIAFETPKNRRKSNKENKSEKSTKMNTASISSLSKNFVLNT